MPTASGESIRRFTDRHAAGRELGERLRTLAADTPIVFGVARGGVPVGYEVAHTLGVPLDVLIARKISAPDNPELGIGATAEGGVVVFNRGILRGLLVSTDELEAAVARARQKVDAGVRRYRDGRPLADVSGRVAIIVDDGLATGATARAAARAVRARGPRRLVLAAPVGAPSTVESLRDEADDVICLEQPDRLWAVGSWYEHFEPTSDEEIEKLLDGDPEVPPGRPYTLRTEVRIPAGARLELAGDLTVPRAAGALILFVHGSGSSRRSPRNRHVARVLNEQGLATLLFDLLTLDEERDRANVFDIALLARRLVAVTRWAQREPLLASLPVGYFGASTGAAAALSAAAELGEQICAVVSRGGRPDLAAEHLPKVGAPVLLIVGGRDQLVLELNREALEHLRAGAELAVVPDATHLFEEPGALDDVASLAAQWFERHLAAHGD